MKDVSRRGVLAGLLAGAAWPVFGEAPGTSPRPKPRPSGDKSGKVEDGAGRTQALIEAASLGGQVAYAVVDIASGALVAARAPGKGMPPASTLKAITALYALEHLGARFRYQTRLIATGPLRDGKITGDLILAGGGDPTLSTDDIGDMARALRAAGVTGVTGRFLVWGGALPYVAAIDPGQPEWLGYDPAVSGLNLNFNRVNFTWAQSGGGLQVGFDARAERYAPSVNMARMKVVERDLPIYTYDGAGDHEIWTVASSALNKEGSRWLPVRRPELYAGDVFRTLAADQGIALPNVAVAQAPVEGQILASHESADLPDLLREMMKYSNNMTAEAVGMTASLRVGIADHAGSAPAMARWMAQRSGRTVPQFVDHSGLGGASRISAEDMAGVLATLGPGAGLAGLMKEVRFTGVDLAGGVAPARVMAKTGTLNFVSGLAGYLTRVDGRERAFAIFCADVARRDAIPESEREKPPGLRAWLKRARLLQLQLLAGWG